MQLWYGKELTTYSDDILFIKVLFLLRLYIVNSISCVISSSAKPKIRFNQKKKLNSVFYIC